MAVWNSRPCSQGTCRTRITKQASRQGYRSCYSTTKVVPVATKLWCAQRTLQHWYAVVNCCNSTIQVNMPVRVVAVQVNVPLYMYCTTAYAVFVWEHTSTLPLTSYWQEFMQAVLLVKVLGQKQSDSDRFMLV